MKLVDVRNSVIILIKDAFNDKKVYDEKVEGGFTQGSFAITLKPVMNDIEMVHYRMKTYMVVVQYKNNPDTYDDMYTVYDQLVDNAFSKSFLVESTNNIGEEQNRYLIPRNVRSDFGDDRFSVMFDVSLIDVVQEEQDHVVGEEIEVNFNIET